MASPVTAWPAEQAVWIRSGDARAIPSRFYARTSLGGYSVTIAAVVGKRGPGAVKVTVEQPLGGDGDPVTMTTLRKVTVDRVIQDALSQVRRPVFDASAETGIPRSFRVDEGGEVYLDETLLSGRGRLTVAERLEMVADIYLRALAAGRPPVKAVAEDLPCSRSTAGRLVGQARKAGLLAETSRGRRGSLGDLKRLARNLREAGGEVMFAPGPSTEEPDEEEASGPAEGEAG